ncbi:MAG: 3-oxoacyl-[acyl-carrier-protein] reductase [Candidatus Nealsonbacteria bacterium CG_4_10_14_0_2_um_filter_35_20]|nr:MAG: 3-oxoacyl-[acyl-carrier-protein] reductase [Candidatus Nealsonbacteria bacterium CG_4_10_14_0_2_um_filter_35_20]
MMKDKVVLITGASGGIGKAIAKKFAAAGAEVALNDIAPSEEALKSFSQEIGAKYFLADVSKLEKVEKMVEEIQKEFGRLDVLVNNAGITQDRTLAKMTKEEWQKVIDVNLTGVFNCSKSALPLLIVNQGNIVNISSLVGQRGNFGQTNYAAAKAGIIGFTKSLAKEVGRLGVRVNAIAPGFIETRLTENLPPEVTETVKKFTPLGRFGKPEEVANLIFFLASDQANFITGAVVNIDGGLPL